MLLSAFATVLFKDPALEGGRVHQKLPFVHRGGGEGSGADMDIVVDPRYLLPSRILAWQLVFSNHSRSCHESYCHRQKAHCLTVGVSAYSNSFLQVIFS